MKIKHWAGYGTVVAKRIPNVSCTLHVHVEGDHERGLRRDDEYDQAFHYAEYEYSRKADNISVCLYELHDCFC